jgi:glycerophosphoryl diester phosphodiesterase
MFILEFKNGGEEGAKACKTFYDLLKERFPNYMDQVVLGSFKDEVEEELRTNYPELYAGAAPNMAAQFVITQYLGVNLFDNSNFSCLQIPVSYDVGFDLNLVSKSLVKRAHKRNIAVQYWTINDPGEMRMLIDLGADCLMTDNPKVMREVLKEYK